MSNSTHELFNPDLIFCVLKKKIHNFIEDYIVANDRIDLKEEVLVRKTLEIFMNMNPAVFKRSWINTGLVKTEEFDEDIEDVEEYDVADFILEKEEEESLIEHFLSLQIDDEKAGAQMDVEEQAPIQIPAKKTSKTPGEQLKITSFFK